MAINFNPMQNASSLIKTATTTAAKNLSSISQAVATKIEGYKQTPMTQIISQKVHSAMTSIGHFLRNTNTAVKELGLSGGLSKAIGKIGIDAVSWGAASVEQTEKIMTGAQIGGEKALEGLEKVGHLMGTALGVTAILSGVRDLAGAARCYSRASHLDSCAKQMDTNSPIQKQLANDLKTCADLNRLRGKDKAICGAIDVAVGTSTLVAGALSSGAAAPFAGLIGWGAGQVAKNSLRAFRTGQDTPAQQVQREHISHRLNDHVNVAKTEVTASLADGKPISSDTQARLKAFQSVGLISSKTDISKASPALAKQLASITPEKIESKFTENTETLIPEIKSDATPFQKMTAVAGKVLLLAS